MAKKARKTMKQFGSGAGPSDIGQFGSLAAGSPAYTTDPAVIQSLSQYVSGWAAAVVGGNAAALEDRSALDFLWSYMLFYVLETGIAEWDSGTTYYIGCQVNDGTGQIYVSIQDTNLNHAVSDGDWWKCITGGKIRTDAANFTMKKGDNFCRVTGTTTASLPASPDTGEEHIVKNVDPAGNIVTLSGNGKNIDDAATYTLAERYQFVKVKYNGTAWDIIGW